MTLKAFFEEHTRVAIAFSGGVDSAYLLYAAKLYAKEVCAYYVKTVFQPQFELADAKRLAEELDVKMKIISADVLGNPEVAANPVNRCYFCKKCIFSTIIREAAADGFVDLLDGTNASDDANDRPGMRALLELKVYSPLRICGLTKAEIRRLSKEAGLFTWDKPAYACLATRIPSGTALDKRLLERTEAAEDYLFSLGFKDFRVRSVGEMAKLQITSGDIPLFVENRTNILNRLKEYYASVCLDLEVRDEHRD